MNSKLLYGATLAISLISTLAMANEAPAAPLTRAQVQAEVAQAAAAGTLRRSDYDDAGLHGSAFVSTQTRAQVVAELAADKLDRRRLVGPNADRDYNPAGTAIFETSVLSRAEVKAQTLQAAAAGTLQRSDYDDDQAIARRATAPDAPSRFAQRLKAALARSAS